MAIEIFNRKELKYIITDETYQLLKKELNKYMELDQFNKNNQLYSIHNLYLDTIDNQLIQRSIEKPEYKEKLRLRSYQGFKNDEIVFLEIKKKYQGVVNKRRTRILLSDAMKFIKTRETPEIKNYMNPQVINELTYTINRKQYYPKTYIAYQRVAYFDKGDHDLRITFDTNIISKRNHQEPIQLLEPNLWLMEIKAEKSFPLWITHLLSEHHIYRQSFSKYGKEYLHYINTQIKTPTMEGVNYA